MLNIRRVAGQIKYLFFGSVSSSLNRRVASILKLSVNAHILESCDRCRSSPSSWELPYEVTVL